MFERRGGKVKSAPLARAPPRWPSALRPCAAGAGLKGGAQTWDGRQGGGRAWFAAKGAEGPCVLNQPPSQEPGGRCCLTRAPHQRTPGALSTPHNHLARKEAKEPESTGGGADACLSVPCAFWLVCVPVVCRRVVCTATCAVVVCGEGVGAALVATVLCVRTRSQARRCMSGRGGWTTGRAVVAPTRHFGREQGAAAD